MRGRRATVATPGEWQCKIRTGGVRQLAVANGPNIFQMLLVLIEQSYLMIYWTNFYDFFHQMKVICVSVVNPDHRA